MDGQTELTGMVQRAAGTVLAVAPTLPKHVDIQELIRELTPATRRGYLLPAEDDAVRGLFSRYLTTRAVLLETIQELKPLAYREVQKAEPDHPEVFLIPFAAATLLMRAGRYMVDQFISVPVIRDKLNEAEPRWGIPRKQFTALYRAATSPRNVWTYLEAVRFWQQNRSLFIARYPRDSGSVGELVSLLESEEPWMETSRSYYVTSRLKYRLHSLLRRQQSGFANVTFALFQMSGRIVSELRNHWRRKRVTPKVIQRLKSLLEPGDVIITRHDDAVTNWFLPGFWPHASLYIGCESQRNRLGVTMDTDRAAASRDPVRVLEARKDGVLFRALEDTLAVDACVVIRPRLGQEELRHALSKAITHEGKEYDFEFDFRRADKLACTGLVYRAYDGFGPIQFKLEQRAGRLCLSAEDILDCALDQAMFEVVAVYGYRGNRLVDGPQAKRSLIESYRRDRPVTSVIESDA